MIKPKISLKILKEYHKKFTYNIKDAYLGFLGL